MPDGRCRGGDEHGAEYRIESVCEGVYRFVADRHRAVFMVTTQGMVVTNSMNTEAACWLEAEQDRRFDVPVRYVNL